MAQPIHRSGPMHPGGMGPREKVTAGTWKQLLQYGKHYWIVVIIAIVCSMAGSALTLAGPNILSDVTDTVSEGLSPDTEMLETITEAIGTQVSENMELFSEAMTDHISGNTQSVMTAISEQMQQVNLQAKAPEILADTSIPEADRQRFQQTLADIGQNPEAAQGMFAALPDSIKEKLYLPVTVNGAEITVTDQFAALTVFTEETPDLTALPESVRNAIYTDLTVNGSTISGTELQAAMTTLQALDPNTTDTSAFDRLPESVKAVLYTDLTIEGTTISGADQQTMLAAFSDIDMDGEQTEEAMNAMLESIENLPASIYSLIEPDMDLKKIVHLSVLLIVLYGIGAILSAMQGWIMATVTQRVSKRLREDISQKINRLPMGYYHRNSTGDILSRVTNDVDTIGTSLNMSIGTLVSAVTLLVGSLFMMLITNVTMTIAGVLATAIGFVLMLVIMGHSQRYFSRQQAALGSLNGHIEEIYAGHTVVKAYNGEEKETQTFRKRNEALRVSGFKAQALSGLMMPIMTFIGNFGYVVVCVVGAMLALKGHITFGVIVSFMMYIRFFTQPLSQIAQPTQAMQSAGAAAGRVFEFLDAEEMEDESHKTAQLSHAKGNVTFSHVKFGYEPGKTIIKDFSAAVKSGQKIAIVGPTGAGKTTLVNLLMRFYEIDGGEIQIDNVNTADIKREDVHAQFCMVLQDTWLFEGTVRENLIYCSEDKSEEKMQEACRAVGLDHFIRTLPKGYDTVLDDQVNLSQGQKQQLTIARAMIADKPILILDEATSSIDTKTEQKIQRAMDELMENRTSFVIAHRLSTIKNADLILVLKDGDVIESGTHAQLMEQNGFYAELYNSQFEQAS